VSSIRSTDSTNAWSAAIERFAAADAEDPRGEHSARYHARLAHWVRQLDESASEPLRLAARCQHVRRWEIPRADYPDGRGGYKRWRSDLARHHAACAREMLRASGYDGVSIERVEALLLKRGLKTDAEVQLLEDAICLVFLETELESFATKHARDKLLRVLRKTWNKMSPRGHAEARALAARLAPAARALLDEALDGMATDEHVGGDSAIER
jgi:hypothetical protein